jgi:two-component system response regulator
MNVEEPRKILLIEDNIDDAELTVIAFKLAKTPCKIDVVYDGEEALDYLYCKNKYQNKSKKQVPALILLDLQMPKLSGIEILKEIRNNNKTKSVPVIIFTSSREPNDINAAFLNGANSFIRKPVSSEEFNLSIELISKYWLEINELPR